MNKDRDELDKELEELLKPIDLFSTTEDLQDNLDSIKSTQPISIEMAQKILDDLIQHTGQDYFKYDKGPISDVDDILLGGYDFEDETVKEESPYRDSVEKSILTDNVYLHSNAYNYLTTESVSPEGEVWLLRDGFSLVTVNALNNKEVLTGSYDYNVEDYKRFQECIDSKVGYYTYLEIVRYSKLKYLLYKLYKKEVELIYCKECNNFSMPLYHHDLTRESTCEHEKKILNIKPFTFEEGIQEYTWSYKEVVMTDIERLDLHEGDLLDDIFLDVLLLNAENNSGDERLSPMGKVMVAEERADDLRSNKFIVEIPYVLDYSIYLINKIYNNYFRQQALDLSDFYEAYKNGEKY